MKQLYEALRSIILFSKLSLTGSLYLKKNHLWEKYRVSDGKVYTVFRETVSEAEYTEKECTIVIGFRLKGIGNNSLMHFLFQKLCVLDTPIWVGFRGFRKKFWMVNTQTNDYLGLYQYQGKKNAQKYVNYIVSVLTPLSVHGSVWYKIIDMKFAEYTKKHRVL